MLLLVYCGDVGLAQAGRSTRLLNGDMGIYDQARPFTMEFVPRHGNHRLQFRGLCWLPAYPRWRALPRRIASASKLGALTAMVVGQLVEFRSFAR